MTDTAPTTNARGDQVHPAFGLAVVSRVSGSSRSLFQSDILHNETIRLTINGAVRNRELGRDWVYQGEQVVEIETSLAQWGQLISSSGLGSGVPVTIRSREGQAVPGIEYASRLAESLDEVNASTDKLLADVRDKLAALTEVIEQKKGIKETREALRNLQSTVNNAPSNAAFAIKSLSEAAEHVVSQSVADIEAAALRASELTTTDTTPALTQGNPAGVFEIPSRK